MPTSAVSSANTHDVLGFVGIVANVLFLPLIGLILGLISASKAKKTGHSPTIGRISWIWGLAGLLVTPLLLLVVFLAVPAAQRNSRDLTRKNDMAILAADVQAYQSEHGHYPQSLDDMTNVHDPKDPQGNSYIYTPSPDGCTDQCTGATLQIRLESGLDYTVNP